MRGKIDISHFSEEEYLNITRVITKDIALRKVEQDRINCLQKHFDDTRRAVMVKSVQKGYLSFDEHCLICKSSLLAYCCIFYRGAECVSCEHVVCPNCRTLLLKQNQDTFLCLLCVKKRELKRKSCEWFYEAVEKKFKRFGSAKVLRAICKQKDKVDHQFVTLLAIVRELSFGSGRKCSVARPITSLFKEDIDLTGSGRPSGSATHISRTGISPENASVSEAEDVLETEATLSEDTEKYDLPNSHQKLTHQLSTKITNEEGEEDTMEKSNEFEYQEFIVLSTIPNTSGQDSGSSGRKSDEDDQSGYDSISDGSRFRVNIIDEVRKRMRTKSGTYSQI